MPGEKERMLSGEPYDPTDPELVAERRRARARDRRSNRSAATEAGRREELLADLSGTVEGEAHVEPPFRCDYGYNVHVGDGSFANFGRVVLDACPVEFGGNCLLGPGVKVYTATHPPDAEGRAGGLEPGRPVAVGDDVRIGGRAVLNPGVTVGDRAVIASGAVVGGDVPPGVAVRGNPAEVVRELDPGN